MITRKKYTTNLTLKEINTINSLVIDYKIFDKTKLNMMSVLSYLIKHSAATQEGLRKSSRDIWNMYKRYHKNIKSISNFKKIIYKLKEVKLISIKKIGKINVYHARNFLEVTEEVTEEVTDKKPIESIDMTASEDNEPNTQIQSLNKNYITIINNTSSDVTVDDYKNSPAYKKACEINNKDIVSPDELIAMALNMLKSLRRSSKEIIKNVKESLKNRTNIVRINSEKYVETVVEEKIRNMDLKREKFAIAKAKKKREFIYNKNKKSNTANFTQRKYNTTNLAKYITVGEDADISEDDLEIGTIEPAKAPALANFTQRKYDYDKLEWQLLGWDDEEDEDEAEIGIIEPTKALALANFTQRKYDFEKLE